MLGNGKRKSVKPMKLFEHPDFEQAIIRAADHFRPRGLPEAIIEKDYLDLPKNGTYPDKCL